MASLRWPASWSAWCWNWNLSQNWCLFLPLSWRLILPPSRHPILFLNRCLTSCLIQSQHPGLKLSQQLRRRGPRQLTQVQRPVPVPGIDRRPVPVPSINGAEGRSAPAPDRAKCRSAPAPNDDEAEGRSAPAPMTTAPKAAPLTPAAEPLIMAANASAKAWAAPEPPVRVALEPWTEVAPRRRGLLLWPQWRMALQGWTVSPRMEQPLIR